MTTPNWRRIAGERLVALKSERARSRAWADDIGRLVEREVLLRLHARCVGGAADIAREVGGAVASAASPAKEDP